MSHDRRQSRCPSPWDHHTHQDQRCYNSPTQQHHNKWIFAIKSKCQSIIFFFSSIYCRTCLRIVPKLNGLFNRIFKFFFRFANLFANPVRTNRVSRLAENKVYKTKLGQYLLCNRRNYNNYFLMTRHSKLLILFHIE